VVQAHAPTVIEQLEKGCFVAAAWESDGLIYLIGCHPNLAKGPLETFLVDTRALPRVVLKPRSWEEVPATARLFLVAFGSEARTVEECAEARRHLLEWLAERGQDEMAGIVKHYSSFPFGVRSDALEIINTWRHVLIRGESDQIERFLDEVGRQFERLGWAPASLEERQREYQRSRRASCWTSGPDSRPRVRLCLERATNRRVRGGLLGAYHVDERAGVDDMAEVIRHALRDVLEPAAAAAGVEVSYPRLGPLSRIEPQTLSTLTTLADAGDGRWPLPNEVEPLWRAFLFTAFRGDVAFVPEELTAWLRASGWDERAAAEFTKRFSSDMTLIGEYEDSRR
jgi:hypothetical protein